MIRAGDESVIAFSQRWCVAAGQQSQMVYWSFCVTVVCNKDGHDEWVYFVWIVATVLFVILYLRHFYARQTMCSIVCSGGTTLYFHLVSPDVGPVACAIIGAPQGKSPDTMA